MYSNHSSLPEQLKIFDLWQRLAGLFRPLERKDNVVSVVYRLVKDYKIKVTRSSIIDYLKPHNNYPSLKSICDFFNEINVLNYALRIDEHELLNLKRPFLAHINLSKGRVLMIYTINRESIVYADSMYGKKKIETNRFLEKWDGVVILIEPSSVSGEKDFFRKKSNEIINGSFVPFAILIFCLIAFYSGAPNIFNIDSRSPILIIIFLVHFTGLFFSILLLLNELNLKTSITEKLCHFSSVTDCDAVAKSNVSNVFGDITWADIGICWFTGGLILMFAISGTQILNILAALSITALPYPVFSILYQKFKIRKWCPLCLSVQAVLIGEFILLFRKIDFKAFRQTDLILLVIIFSTVFLLELLIKLNLIIRKEKDHLRLEILRMKRDPEMFINKLKSGEKIKIPDIESTLDTGNPNSKVTITIFLSLMCSACARKFPDILNFIKSDIRARVKLVFYPSKDELTRKMFKLISTLTETGSVTDTLEIIAKWYNLNISSRIKLIDSFRVNCQQVMVDSLIDRSSEFFETCQVTRVPSIFVEGYPLPELYNIDDIIYHIEDIEKIELIVNEIEV